MSYWSPPPKLFTPIISPIGTVPRPLQVNPYPRQIAGIPEPTVRSEVPWYDTRFTREEPRAFAKPEPLRRIAEPEPISLLVGRTLKSSETPLQRLLKEDTERYLASPWANPRNLLKNR